MIVNNKIRPRISIRGLVRPSVGRSIRWSVRRSVTLSSNLVKNGLFFVSLNIVLSVDSPCFLDASSHLYKRVCPSVRRSVGPSVGPSNNVKKVDSAPKNGLILMHDGSLEAYGQVL